MDPSSKRLTRVNQSLLRWRREDRCGPRRLRRISLNHAAHVGRTGWHGGMGSGPGLTAAGASAPGCGTKPGAAFAAGCVRSASLKLSVANFPSLLIVTLVAPTRSDHSMLAML